MNVSKAFRQEGGFYTRKVTFNEQEGRVLIAKESHRSFHFQSQLVWNDGRNGSASIDGKPVMQLSSPAEFKGDPACWSPEDLFVTAASACLLMTFLAYAQREELELVKYESSADGTLEYANGRYRFTEVILRPRLTFRDELDAEIAATVLDQAHRDCIITNSVTTAVRLEPEIRVETAQ